MNEQPEEHQLDYSGKCLPEDFCPTCRYRTDSATCAKNSRLRPKPGDLTVCLNCGEVLEFQNDMKMKLATVSALMACGEELHALIVKAQSLIRSNRFLDK